MGRSLATLNNSLVLYTRVDARDWKPVFRNLPQALQTRISQFQSASDRNARIAGYFLLEKILRETCETHIDLTCIAYASKTGRPSIPSQHNLDFNLSHSGAYAVCAASIGGRIGVDIERIQPIDIHEGRDAFSETVWHEIVHSPDPLQAFYREWTRMEAVAKAEGFGIGGPVQSIRYEAHSACVGKRKWHLLEVPLADGYCCCVASSCQITTANVRAADD